ncbi:ABC transporter permease, partial [Actinotignum sanguinis]
ESTERQVTAIIAAIGGIVILVGALGLLTVSIVTMKQRVREMGIRRAMGASARRIFTSVFLESVVATTAAGFIGVIASIVTIRTAPLARWLDLPFSVDSVGYPVLAAFIGLAISAGVGALCGIIPATMALRIKPIDAIRF